MAEKRRCKNPECGKSFTPLQDGAGLLYCSSSCSEENRQAKNKDRMKAMQNIVCENCGKETKVKKKIYEEHGAVCAACRYPGRETPAQVQAKYNSRRLDNIKRPQKWYPLAPNVGSTFFVGHDPDHWIRDHGQGLVNGF